ncbi:DgyrCDS5908 [Dimorphilus gyrociliatus]|uniref:DgyrCDS5908 n=1 Tax=Dimorphilus gyrociliatus TaxID=2664684 RepID=A0A7I8VN01_9ANNE|nr:DgyrCDS5908 [Dimorphilus gyrociliatus]
MDPFYCSCSACKKFLTKYFKGYESLLYESEDERVRRTRVVSASLGKSGNKDSCSIRVGDRVIIRGNQKGFVKFIGPLSDNIGAELYIGVQLDENVGSHTNGIIRGKRYFYCPPGHGAFVKYPEAKLIPRYNKRPNTRSGNNKDRRLLQRSRTMPNLTGKQNLKRGTGKYGDYSGTIEKLREAYEIGLILESNERDEN